MGCTSSSMEEMASSQREHERKLREMRIRKKNDLPDVIDHVISTRSDGNDWSVDEAVNKVPPTPIPTTIEASDSKPKLYVPSGILPKANSDSKEWKAAVENDLKLWAQGPYAGLDSEFMKNNAIRLLSSWPRGDGPGELLLHPIEDDRSVEHRGVAKEWFRQVWSKLGYYFHFVPTRIVVSCFVKALTQDDAVPFYTFVPLKYRGHPTAFISHCWDGMLFDVFHAASSDAFNWMDIFAINQHKNTMVEALTIGSIVHNISNTVFVIPGAGIPAIALRSMYRSWCMYELANTPDNALSVHISGLSSISEHREMISAMVAFSVKDAEASVSYDKTMIDQLLLDRFGSFEAADNVLKPLIVGKFKQVYVELGEGGIAKMYTDFLDAIT